MGKVTSKRKSFNFTLLLKCFFLLLIVSLLFSLKISTSSKEKFYLPPISLSDRNKNNEVDSNLFLELDPIDQLVIFGKYRIAVNKFSFVGISSYSFNQNNNRKKYNNNDYKNKNILNNGICIWKNAEKKVYLKGNMTVVFPGDDHGRSYITTIIHCTFTIQKNEKNLEFGKLILSFHRDNDRRRNKNNYINVNNHDNNDNNDNDYNNKIEIKEFLVYDEIKIRESNKRYYNHHNFFNGYNDDLNNNNALKDNNNYNKKNNNNFKYDIAYCSPPIIGKLNKNTFMQWMHYHIMIGVEYYVFYDAGIENVDFDNIMHSLVLKNKYEIVNIKKITKYNAWNHGQIATNNDCNFKMKYISKWAIFYDLDEYVYFPIHFFNLISFLNEYEGNSSISLGSLTWYTDHCVSHTKKKNNVQKYYAKTDGKHYENYSSRPWAIETFCFRQKMFFCDLEKFSHELCPRHHGYRKFITSPNLASVLLIHWVSPHGVKDHDDKMHVNKIVNLNAKIAHINHYPGLAFANSSIFSFCKKCTNNCSFVNLTMDDSMPILINKFKIH